MAVETREMLQLIVSLATLFAFAYCYAAGGRHDKWIRRYVGSALLMAGCHFLAITSNCWSPWMILSSITFPFALSVGYGADSVPDKLRKRAIYGLAVGAASAPFLMPIGLWHALFFQIGLAVGSSVYLGVTNPTSAVGEEGSLSVLMVAIVPFMLIR